MRQPQPEIYEFSERKGTDRNIVKSPLMNPDLHAILSEAAQIFYHFQNYG